MASLEGWGSTIELHPRVQIRTLQFESDAKTIWYLVPLNSTFSIFSHFSGSPGESRGNFPRLRELPSA